MLSEKDFLEKIKDASGVAGMKNAAAKRVFDAFLDTIKEELMKGEKVSLYKFGVFNVIETKERVGRNVATGETITIPAGKKVKFSPSSSLKSAVKSK